LNCAEMPTANQKIANYAEMPKTGQYLAKLLMWCLPKYYYA